MHKIYITEPVADLSPGG